MPCHEVHGPSEEAVSKTDGSLVTDLGVQMQPFGIYISAVATTQVAFLEFMSQCTLAWLNASTGRTVSGAPDHCDAQAPKQHQSASRSASRAVRISGSEWLSMPVITGIEETLSDQFTKPRSVRAQESEVLALWKRSNEFEVVHLADHTDIVNARHDVA